MKVTIKTYADPEKSYDGILDLKNGSTVKQALEEIDLLDATQLKLHMLAILVNQKNAELDVELKDGDRILLLQSMAGG